MVDDSREISRRGLVRGATFAAAATLAVAIGERARAATVTGKASQPTIFATGGGFFPGIAEKSLFPEYLLALSPVKRPRICWLGAASGENPMYFEMFARGMEAYNCETRHFNIFEPATLDFVDYLMGMDIVFVGGGSTKNLMALWREWGFDKALKSAWEKGVVMAGGSAGLICWFQSGLTDSYPPVLAPVKGVGILPGSANPHYDIRADRHARYRTLIADGSIDSPGLALDQDAGVLFRGTKLVEIVSKSKTARAYRLTRTTTGVDETTLPVRYLGD